MADKIERVHGISAQDFHLWKHHPVTQLLHKFLTDKKAFVQTSVTDQFLAGTLRLGDDNAQCLRGQMIEMQELIDLPFEALVNFYASDDGTNAV
jgi:hypothetical protein